MRLHGQTKSISYLKSHAAPSLVIKRVEIDRGSPAPGR